MKKLLFGLFVLLTISCNEKTPNTEFTLLGSVKGIENGTVLYLDCNQITIDSTIIEKKSFVFNTKLPKSPLLVVLRTKNFSHYRFMWLENKHMTFDATKSDFKTAIVTGSDEENLSQSLVNKTDRLPRDERLKQELEFVNDNPNSINSAYILSVYTTTWGKMQTKKLFDQFSVANKCSEYGKSIAKYIELNRNPKIGEKFIDFEMADTTGTLRKLSELKGKFVLLEFWASGCWSCRQENPNLIKTYEKYKSKGFEIFAVSSDIKRESWLKAIKKDNLPWLQVSELNKDNSAFLIYGINSIPNNFLIDKNGFIIEKNLRGEELNEKLSKLLN